MYTWIDMTFLRPWFAERDKFLIPNSGNKYNTLMYHIQSNGKQYIYNIYSYRTSILQEIAHFINPLALDVDI